MPSYEPIGMKSLAKYVNVKELNSSKVDGLLPNTIGKTDNSIWINISNINMFNVI